MNRLRRFLLDLQHDPYLRLSLICLIALVLLIAVATRECHGQPLDGQDGHAVLPAASTPVVLTSDRSVTPAPSRIFTPLAISFAGLATTDVLQSQFAIHSGRFHEVNPAFGSGGTVRMSVTKGLATGGILFAAYSLRAKHPRMALVLVSSFLAVQGYAVAHNYAVMR